MTKTHINLEHALKGCPLISVNPEIKNGTPCIKGTRVPVHMILEAMATEKSVHGVKQCYPGLTSEQIEEALLFSKLIVFGIHND